MDIIQSFLVTISRNRLSVMEQRVLYKIVESLQVQFRGKLLKDNFDKWRGTIPEHYAVSLQMAEVLNGSKHYEDVVLAVKSLCGKVIEWSEPRSCAWHATSLIYDARHLKGSGIVSFFVCADLIRLILDFSFGFSRFDLEKMLALKSPYAMRLYALMSSQRHPIALRISTLYEMFSLSGKYSQVSDFEKKILRPAKKALDDAKMNSFSYQANKPGRKIISYTFFPIRREIGDKKSLLAKLPVSAVCSGRLKQRLMRDFGFSNRELSAHKEMLDEFSKVPDFEMKLADIFHRFTKSNKGKGWVIAALRSEVEND